MPRQTGCERLSDPTDPRIWTAHEHIDITRITSGRQILLSGHKFWVTDMIFTTTGRATGYPGPDDFAAGVAQVDLKLMHTQWKGCPAVDPPRRLPVDCAAALTDLHDAARRLLASPGITAADAEFVRAQLAPIVDLDEAKATEADG